MKPKWVPKWALLTKRHWNCGVWTDLWLPELNLMQICSMLEVPVSTSRLLKPWQCNKHFHFNCIKMMTQFKSSHFHHLGWKHWLITLSVKLAVLARKQIALSNGASSQLALCKQSWPMSKLARKLIELNQMRLTSQTRKKRWHLSWPICKKKPEKSCNFLFFAFFFFFHKSVVQQSI